MYSGTTLIEESNSTHTIYYLYGQSGLIGFELDGVSYYYVRNLLGDVTGVIDTSGNLVVQYAYDSWGKVLSTTGSMADTVGTLNPIRYRGYYYDVETGLYYLQSRYYDPETGRFISPDVIAEGGNIYTYCLNDPVNRSDESGYLSRRDKNIIKIAIGVVTTVAAVAITVATGGAALPVIAGVAASTLIGAGISAGITALQGGSDEEIFDSAVDGAIDGFMWGGLSAFASASFSAIRSSGAALKASTTVTQSDIGRMATAGSPQQVGKAGERLSGITKNTKKIMAPSGNVRIPDGLTNTKLYEVKNVSRLSKTSQLTDFMEYATAENLQMILYVRPTTSMSSPLIAAIKQHSVIIRYLW